MTDEGGESPASVAEDCQWVSPVAHDTDNHQPFPFFDLPPELRNRIYSFSVKDTRRITELFTRRSTGHITGRLDLYGIYNVRLADYFRPSLQRICKQFRHEYEKEVLKSAALSSRICAFGGPDQQYWQNFLPLRDLKRLYLRVDYGHCRDPGFSEIRRRLKECVRLFPSVDIIRLRIDLFVYLYDDLIDKECRHPEDVFQLPPFDGGRVQVQFELSLHSRLFKVHNPCQNSNGEADRVSPDTPMVIFRASPSSGPYTYRGLDLEVESVGSFGQSSALCMMGGEEDESLYRL